VIDDWKITITDVEGRFIQNLELTKTNAEQQILIGSH
jgi:magnesium and cobalt transporter